MNLNYDCLYLVKDQVKLDLFFLFTCRMYKGLIKNKKYTIGEVVDDEYPFTHTYWLGMKHKIHRYILGVLEGIGEDKYKITFTSPPSGKTGGCWRFLTENRGYITLLETGYFYQLRQIIDADYEREYNDNCTFVWEETPGTRLLLNSEFQIGTDF